MKKQKKLPPGTSQYFSEIGRKGGLVKSAKLKGKRPKKVKCSPEKPPSVENFLSKVGKLGGLAKNQALTPEERINAARHASNARWARIKAATDD
jgi:hypothetical protein